MCQLYFLSAQYTPDYANKTCLTVYTQIPLGSTLWKTGEQMMSKMPTTVSGEVREGQSAHGSFNKHFQADHMRFQEVSIPVGLGSGLKALQPLSRSRPLRNPGGR